MNGHQGGARLRAADRIKMSVAGFAIAPFFVFGPRLLHWLSTAWS